RGAGPFPASNCVASTLARARLARHLHLSVNDDRSGRFPRLASHASLSFPPTHPRGPAASPGCRPRLFPADLDIPPRFAYPFTFAERSARQGRRRRMIGSIARGVFAVVLGFLAALFFVVVLEGAWAVLYPFPEGADPYDIEVCK